MELSGLPQKSAKAAQPTSNLGADARKRGTFTGRLSQDKAAPDRPKGRSQPSTQENIHPNKATKKPPQAPARG